MGREDIESRGHAAPTQGLRDRVSVTLGMESAIWEVGGTYNPKAGRYGPQLGRFSGTGEFHLKFD